MPEPLPTDRVALIQQRLESLASSLRNANAPAAPAEPPDRPSKPIAMTLRLDTSQYARLNTYASQFTPRRSFQAIITEALDAFLSEQTQRRR